MNMNMNMTHEHDMHMLLSHTRVAHTHDTRHIVCVLLTAYSYAPPCAARKARRTSWHVDVASQSGMPYLASRTTPSESKEVTTPSTTGKPPRESMSECRPVPAVFPLPLHSCHCSAQE